MKLQDFLPYFVLDFDRVLFYVNLSDLYVSESEWSCENDLAVLLKTDGGRAEYLCFNGCSLRYDIRYRRLIASSSGAEDEDSSLWVTPPVRGISRFELNRWGEFESQERFWLDDNRRLRIL